jgi:hypothetical protein
MVPILRHERPRTPDPILAPGSTAGSTWGLKSESEKGEKERREYGAEINKREDAVLQNHRDMMHTGLQHNWMSNL